MKDKDISKLNEAEFDDLLLDLSDAPPPAEVTDELSPWRTAMSRIVWGIGWTTITLNFLHLDFLLPCVGAMMMLLGFRSLRRENRWFALGYGCAWVRLLWWLLTFGIRLTVFNGDQIVTELLTRGAWAILLVELGMLLALRNGIRAVQRKTGLPAQGGTGLIVWKLISIFLALINLSGLLALLFIIVYIFFLVELHQLSKELDEAGYAISPAPVRVSDGGCKRAYTAAIAAVALVCYLFLGKYPMDWKPTKAPTGDAVQAVRQELLDLGFPEVVLNDLTEEEILACSGADFVLTETKDEQIDRKRIVSLSLEQPENTLRITYVGLRFPGERRESWKLFHHFRWLSNDGFCGTEAIQMWPASFSGNWKLTSEFTGRVLYDHKGEAYASGYHFLGTMTTSGWLGPSEDLYAAFSLPSRGENQRGYLIYDVRAMSEGASISSWFNYVHQYSRLQFPVQTAMQAEANGSPGFGWGFCTNQSAFQFSTYGEFPKLF